MKYLLLKHYRGGPTPVVDLPTIDHWAPGEFDAHVQFMRDFATRLEQSGEFVAADALAPEGTFVRYGGEGRPPVTDGPFAETKEQLGGFYLVECANLDEAIDWAAKIPNVANGTVEIRPVWDFEADAPKS